MTDPRALEPDPAPRLMAAFRAIAPRMAGLDFVNPALEVEAIGFAPWQGHWLGVMVTPWFMNLLLLPRDRAVWQPLPAGAKRRYLFPAGVYEFVGANDAAVGQYHACSLFSPVLEFDDHASARLVARLARDALFDPANAEAPEPAAATPAPGTAAAPGPLAQMEERLATPLSKRGFLRGRFLVGDHGDRG